MAEATYNLAFVPLRGKMVEHWTATAGQSAINQLQDALARFEELDDRAGMAKAKGNIALFLGGLGEFESARPLLEEAIASYSYRELGDMFHLAHSLGEYGRGLQMLGYHEEATAPMLDSLDLFHQADNLMGIGQALESLSSLESARGRHERAMRLFGSAQEIGRSTEGGYPVRTSSLVGIDAVGEARKAIGEDAVDQDLAEGLPTERGMTETVSGQTSRADAVR